MLTIYRRHLKSCEHRAEGRAYRRCHCPIWADGFIGDRDIRQSLELRDWQKANETIQEWEAMRFRSSGVIFCIRTLADFLPKAEKYADSSFLCLPFMPRQPYCSTVVHVNRIRQTPVYAGGNAFRDAQSTVTAGAAALALNDQDTGLVLEQTAYCVRT